MVIKVKLSLGISRCLVFLAAGDIVRKLVIKTGAFKLWLNGERLEKPTELKQLNYMKQHNKACCEFQSAFGFYDIL